MYGDGLQQRDWIHADDHSAGVFAVLERGTSGRVYHFAGGQTHTNLEIVRRIVKAAGGSEDQIEHVADRPGHDRLYALDDSRTRDELGWAPTQPFGPALEATVAWYLAHPGWCRAVAGEGLRTFLEANYGGRGPSNGA